MDARGSQFPPDLPADALLCPSGGISFTFFSMNVRVVFHPCLFRRSTRELRGVKRSEKKKTRQEKKPQEFGPVKKNVSVDLGESFPTHIFGRLSFLICDL